MCWRTVSRQLDVFGTPMPVKTPVNYAERKAIKEKQNRDALKQLIKVSIMSVFFITA